MKRWRNPGRRAAEADREMTQPTRMGHTAVRFRQSRRMHDGEFSLSRYKAHTSGGQSIRVSEDKIASILLRCVRIEHAA
jgi:hypothetical protein